MDKNSKPEATQPRCTCGHKARSHGPNWHQESPEKEATGFPVCHYPGCKCLNYCSVAAPSESVKIQKERNNDNLDNLEAALIERDALRIENQQFKELFQEYKDVMSKVRKNLNIPEAVSIIEYTQNKVLKDAKIKKDENL